MLENIKSVFFVQWLFEFLEKKLKLKLISHNKSLQIKTLINIIDYKK